MAATYGQHYDETLNDVSHLLASSRLSQRWSRDSGTLATIRSARGSRIEKPRSNNNSPHRAERRRAASLARTTAYQSPMANVVYHNSLGRTVVHPYQSNSRPLTWHPESFQNVQPFTESHDNIERSELDPAAFSQTFKATPFQRDAKSSLDWTMYQPRSYQHDLNNNQQFSHLGVNWDAFEILNKGYDGTYAQEVPETTWYLPGTGSTVSEHAYDQVASQPNSTDSLSIQHPPELVADTTPQMQQPTSSASSGEQGDKILVGLGLYDPPATPPHPFMAALSRGKGLKLEEPWAPPPDSGDEDAEGEDEDENGGDTATPYGLPAASHNVVKQMQQQAQIHDQSQQAIAQQTVKDLYSLQPGSQSQPFVLGGSDGVDGDWWYDPAARMRAQEQHFGHGWLHE